MAFVSANYTCMRRTNLCSSIRLHGLGWGGGAVGYQYLSSRINSSLLSFFRFFPSFFSLVHGIYYRHMSRNIYAFLLVFFAHPSLEEGFSNQYLSFFPPVARCFLAPRTGIFNGERATYPPHAVDTGSILSFFAVFLDEPGPTPTREKKIDDTHLRKRMRRKKRRKKKNRPID